MLTFSIFIKCYNLQTVRIGSLCLFEKQKCKKIKEPVDKKFKHDRNRNVNFSEKHTQPNDLINFLIQYPSYFLLNLKYLRGNMKIVCVCRS